MNPEKALFFQIGITRSLNSAYKLKLAMCASKAHIKNVSTITKEPKSERLVARVSRQDKNLLERAAAIEGLSVARFIIAQAMAKAGRILGEHQTIRLNEAESRRFVDALLAPPRPPTRRMKRAVALYRRSVRES